MRKRFVFLACVVAGFLIVGALFCEVADPGVAVAAIPTPVGDQAGGGDWLMVSYWTSDFNNYTTTVSSASKHAPAYTAGDFTWTVDVSGTIATTCTIQFSNDNSNWAGGVNVLANVQADETNIGQYELFGRYHRIQCAENVATSYNTVTTTIISKLMN